MQTNPLKKRLTQLLILAAAVGLFAACSDVEDAADRSSGTQAQRSSAQADDKRSAANVSGGDTSECPATDLSLTIPDAGIEGAFDAASTQAIAVAGGAGYTIWVTDFPVDPSSIDGLSSAPTTADGTTFSVLLTVFNSPGDPAPIEPGDTAPASTDFGKLVFNTLATVAGVDFNNNSGMNGEVVVDSVDQNRICLSIDYSDDQKTAFGTITADIVAALPG